MYQRYFLAFAFLVVSIVGCRKAEPDESSRVNGASCERLKNAMKNHDVDQARIAITEFIARLYSDDYTIENINELVKLIENSCGIDTELFCFSCIDTFPPQTEIVLRVRIEGVMIVKIIDLSYKTTDNKIRFMNMHN